MVVKNFVHIVKTNLTKVRDALLSMKNVSSLVVRESISEKDFVNLIINNLSELPEVPELVVLKRRRNGTEKVLLSVKCSKNARSILFPKQETSTDSKKSAQHARKKEVTKKQEKEQVVPEHRCSGPLSGYRSGIGYLHTCETCGSDYHISYISE
jgi:hypothetical protein